MPIYIVNVAVKEEIIQRLIDAPNRSRAIAFVAANTIRAEVAEASDLIALTKSGVALEKAA